MGRRCEQPVCYGRVRQVHDIEEEDKIAFKEKWKLSTLINKLCFGRCEFYSDIDALKYRSRDRTLG